MSMEYFKKTTKLDEAKKIPVRRQNVYKPSDEELDLAIALMKDEVTVTQIYRAKCLSTHSTVYPWLFKHLQAGVREGRIIIEKIK